MRKIFNLFFVLFVLFVVQSSFAKEPWHIWLNQVKAEAIAEGISPQLVNQAFRGMTPSKAHISLDRKQPEKRLTFLKYRNTRNKGSPQITDNIKLTPAKANVIGA